MPRAPSRPLIALDLLRFACAGGVVAYHLLAANVAQPSDHARAALAGLALPRASVSVTWAGWIGVELFFVISGYVIARSAEGSDRAAFLRRRAWRLLPTAALCATATLAVLALGGVDPPARLATEWLVSAALLPAGTPIDASFWTLPIECAFYLLVAATMGTRASARRLETIGVVLGAASIAFWLGGNPRWSAGAMHVPGQLVLYGIEFAFGMALAAFHRDGGRGRAGWLMLLAGGVLATVAVHAGERTQALHLAAGPLVPMLLTAIGLAVLALAPRCQPWLERTGCARGATTLGLMSYPLYLVHQDAGAAVTAALMHAGAPFAAAVAGATALALAWAWVVVAHAEPRLRRGVRAAAALRFRGPAPDTPPTASLPTG